MDDKPGNVSSVCGEGSGGKEQRIGDLKKKKDNGICTKIWMTRVQLTKYQGMILKYKEIICEKAPRERETNFPK